MHLRIFVYFQIKLRYETQTTKQDKLKIDI